MNAIPKPDDQATTPGRGPADVRGVRVSASPANSVNPAHPPPPGTSPPGTSDPLGHPDPHRVAHAAAVETLLRCWVRETDQPAPADGVLRIPLPASGTALTVPVRYWSPTGWHRFGLPRLADVPDHAPPADAVTIAALLSRETSADGHGQRDGRGQGQGDGHSNDHGHGHGAEGRGVDGVELVAGVADSLRRVTSFLSDRREPPVDVPDLFLAAEQSLVLGHPLHPTPKSREGLSEAEARLYSPEVCGSFPLHWMAVSPSVLATDSAWTERGRPVAAARLTARLAETDLPLPDGYALLPLHPWQAREVRHRPETAALLDSGLLRDLGTHGTPWHPTSSVRTVYRSGAPAMLKLSLGLRITNSRRENLRKELHRGVEVHRLLRSGLAQQWRAVHPCFDIVRDPAWIAVGGPGGPGGPGGAVGSVGSGGTDGTGGSDGAPLTGLDVVIRHNPFSPSDDVSCVAGFVSPRPCSPARPGTAPDRPDIHGPVLRSRLAEVVTRLARRTGWPRGAVAVEWFLRYLEHVVRPVLWLDGEAGIALEAHQQNTLLLLDPDGWPVGGRYRDNQGYYFRESRRADLDARLPGVGERSDTFVCDEVTDERFVYYLAVNNVLGVIGAFGSQGLADERLLLAAFRRFLGNVAAGPARLRSSLPARLLDSPVLRCKANLLTRLHGLDELVGPVDTQSVYVTIANPLHR
ncbi:siderophore synthetase component [Streptomyces africanus]|uniref:Siderophore synthetase component n=1 Tax=Streptomyces africanus TaxID=231024 RepID=A0ABU0QWF7_9ACTN|nr:siderophore synthetase component [Streptomyces africanus]